MSREDRLIWERVWTDPIKTPILTADHVKYIKDVFINCLRDVFARDPDFTYIRAEDGIFPAFDNENLGIVVTDVYTYNTEFLPAVTIRIGSSNLVPVSFNQNQKTYSYHRSSDGSLQTLWQEFSGLYDTSVTVNIHTWDPLAREELVTRIALLFKHILRDQLYVDFGVFVKGVSVSGETETPWSQDNNDMIFSQSISVDVLSGWNNRLPVGDKLESINMQIIGDVAPHIYPPNEPKGGPCGGGGAWKGTPTQEDLIRSNRVDWIDEIRTCPELVLEDALVWNTDINQFELTSDWCEILINSCGLTITEVADQINTGSWLREELLRAANSFRETADVRRKNKGSAFKSGTPSTGYTYKFTDGITIKPNNTVVFPGNITVSTIGVVYFPTSKITADRDDNVSAPANVDIDAWANPFTATVLEKLEAFQFCLILLEVVSPTRQSQQDLGELISEFVATLVDPNQIVYMENVRTNVDSYMKNKYLINKQSHI